MKHLICATFVIVLGPMTVLASNSNCAHQNKAGRNDAGVARRVASIVKPSAQKPASKPKTRNAERPKGN